MSDPIAATRDPAGTDLTEQQLAGLRAFLVDCGESPRGPLTATLLAGGRSNLTYRLRDDVRSWALRRPPLGGVIESAHDMVREYRVVAALGPTGVPVPRAVGCDATGAVIGAPAAIVDFVAGRTVRSRADLAGWTDADVAACATALVEVLVRLHKVDPAAVGLGDFGRPGGYAARQLRRWSRQWTEMGATDPRAERLAADLGARLVDQDRSGVLHGDFRVDNTILADDDPGAVRALVDWELSTLGDPVADVALMCAYRHPALDGVLGIEAAWTSDRFPPVEELRAMYEERAGRALPHWHFHLALAFYKLAVIAEGIAYRHRLGATAGEGYEGVAATVPVLLEAGLEVVGRRD
ncbi:phosphotransferase family protein [Blastococcus sp. PRF04-17]|uniref:phosphotransferase family protein n=1 Tax=Blastococcus sp. PRF04-17 TaxID=2933797 RepID=UPI001FF5A566|nr:phosphotransferase family protein [Blastococcus sp. PRF04-17]UOY02605.1 phosphotransferase family protein [Blastococcus sp. PRF04-17]